MSAEPSHSTRWAFHLHSADREKEAEAVVIMSIYKFQTDDMTLCKCEDVCQLSH